jgi:hypothetical protein
VDSKKQELDALLEQTTEIRTNAAEELQLTNAILENQQIMQ